MELFHLKIAKRAKSQSSSIQRARSPQAINTNSTLPIDDGLTEYDINKTFASDRSKRRIAHVSKFALPVNQIQKPITGIVVNKPGILPEMEQYSNTKPCKVRTLDDTKARRTYNRNPARKRKANDDGVVVKNKKRKDDIVKIMLRGKRSRKSKKSA